MGQTRNLSKLIPLGSRVKCADNSGAKSLQVIGYLNMQGTRKRRVTGGVADLAVVTVKKGTRELKKKYTKR
jgi:large subunit ribosomal protein L14